MLLIVNKMNVSLRVPATSICRAQCNRIDRGGGWPRGPGYDLSSGQLTELYKGWHGLFTLLIVYKQYLNLFSCRDRVSMENIGFGFEMKFSCTPSGYNVLNGKVCLFLFSLRVPTSTIVNTCWFPKIGFMYLLDNTSRKFSFNRGETI